EEPEEPEDPLSAAFHCRYRALGLAIRSPDGVVYAFDHALHVSSGVAVLPLRVKISISPGRAFARQRISPHVATVPASRTSDSYAAVAERPLAIPNTLPGLLVAATMRPDDSRISDVTCRAATRASSVARAGSPERRKIFPSLPVPISSDPLFSIKR